VLISAINPQKPKDPGSMPNLLPAPTNYALPISKVDTTTTSKMRSNETTVTINIGRIEVRAIMSQQKQSLVNPSSTKATNPAMQNPSSSDQSTVLTLKEYLKKRSERLF